MQALKAYAGSTSNQTAFRVMDSQKLFKFQFLKFKILGVQKMLILGFSQGRRQLGVLVDPGTVRLSLVSVQH